MLKFIINILRSKFGLDRSIFWGALNKAFGLIKGPVSIYFLIKFLTPQDQGLWYTFSSLGALTVLAELGFTSIITQFVSHEYAIIKDKANISNRNSTENDRLICLIKFSVKFYLFIIPLAILVLLIVGFFYFKTETFSVKIAWSLYSVVGGVYLFLGLLQSVYQGLDKVKDIQINIFYSSVIITFLNWIMLMLHFKIWALVCGNFFGLVISSFLLYRIAPEFWNLIISNKSKNSYDFFEQTLPLQLRYALTSISSYFVTYLYVPVTYKLVGGVQAGQLGMSIVIFTAINGIASNWIQTKVPKFNMLVSLKDKHALNKMFRTSNMQGLLVLIILYAFFLIGLEIAKEAFPSIAARFLDFNLCLLLILPQIAQYFINSFAVYLRAHKQEPYMWLIVLNAVLLIGSVFYIFKSNLGLKVLFYCLNVIYVIVILPIAVKIFYAKKLEYSVKYYASSNG